MPRIISINVGKPKTHNWKGDIITTSIFKIPVPGTVTVNHLNLEGDEQSDLRVHGGPNKAVYAYPAEHYDFWSNELNKDLPWGSFGENLTTEGLVEEEVRVGDIFQIGSVRLQVTQPRFPCFKLGLKFGDAGMVKKFVTAERNGFYLRVLQEGEIRGGDDIFLTEKSKQGIAISDFIKLYLGKEKSLEMVAKAMGSPGLPGDWIDFLVKISAGMP